MHFILKTDVVLLFSVLALEFQTSVAKLNGYSKDYVVSYPLRNNIHVESFLFLKLHFVIRLIPLQI